LIDAHGDSNQTSEAGWEKDSLRIQGRRYSAHRQSPVARSV
jgi:hypothetical protein